MTTIIHKATCMCGDITIEAKGMPNFAEYCHCITCQQSAGSSYIIWVVFDKENVKITSGELSYYQSSKDLKRGFCGNCGATMSIHTPTCFDLALGVLEKPDDIEISQHIWTTRALKHVVFDDDLPKYDKDDPKQ